MKQPPKETEMWFAVYTRSRCEKAVSRALEQKKITHYLPVINRKRLYSNRTRSISCPLIPGYIFVQIAFRDYVPVLQTEHVVDFVRFGSEINPIPQMEIDLLRQFSGDTEHEIILAANHYQEGDEVEVTMGPLKGIKGTLITVKGRKSLIVELKNVGHSLQVVHMKLRHVRRLGKVPV
jgi:transcription antitermination factor NusG